MLWLSRNDKIKKYKEIRENGRELQTEVVKVIPKAVINRTARDMNMLSGNTLILDSQAELDFLFDRIIYDVPWEGKTAIEHFEAKEDTELSQMEKGFLEAMKKAYFSLFEVTGVKKGEYLQLSDLLGNKQIELIDLSLSVSAAEGILLATRIIEIEDICMTTGAGYPFLPDQRERLLSGLKARPTARKGKRRQSLRSKDFSDPKNYSLYFYRQYKRVSELTMETSSDLFDSDESE